MTGRVVVDASVVVKWLVPERHSGAALRILDDHLDGRVVATVPSYALLEVANALRKYVVRGLLGRKDAAEALSILEEVGLEVVEPNWDMLGQALGYAVARSITVYDAYYIILAKHYNTVFYTADERLVRQLQPHEPLVRHVDSYTK